MLQGIFARLTHLVNFDGSYRISMKPPENDMSQWVSRCHTSRATQLRCGPWSFARTVFGGGGGLYSYGTRGSFRATVLQKCLHKFG